MTLKDQRVLMTEDHWRNWGRATQKCISENWKREDYWAQEIFKEELKCL